MKYALPTARGFASENGGQHVETSRRFKFAINTQGKDKDWNFQKLATGYRDVEGTLDNVIQHVANGHALCAGLLDGKTRSKKNVVGTYWVLLDIDNEGALIGPDGKPAKTPDGKQVKIYKPELTLEEALKHPFIRQYCALIYTSASHHKIPGWDKFRLVFLLPDYLEGYETVEELVKLLMEQLPHDQSCKDASRVFYGNSKAQFPLINREACLPDEWLNIARERLAARKAKEIEDQQLREQRRAQAKAERAAGVVSLSTWGQTLSEVLEEDINHRIQDDPGLLFSDLEGWKGAGKNCWCPFCTIQEPAPSFNVAAGKPVWICYGCSPDGGNYVSYVRKRFGYSYFEAVKHLADLTGISIPELESKQSGTVTTRTVTTRTGLPYQSVKGEIPRKLWLVKGFGKPKANELTPAEERERLINKQKLTFQTRYWENLKPDFLLGKADREYEGYCPTIDIGFVRTHLIQGWLGAGKTTAIIRSLARANSGKLVIWVTTKNGLLYMTEARAIAEGIVHVYHYQLDVSGNRLLLDSGSEAFIGMAVDSFKDYAVGRIDWENTILVIDEFRSVRCEVLKKTEEFPQFEEALRRAETVIVADAFLSDADRAILKSYRGSNRLIYRQKFQKSKKRIYWIEALTKKGEISFTHEGAYPALLDQFIKMGGRTAVGVDNLLIANQIALYLRKRGKTVKLVSSRTVESNQVFMPDPDSVIEAEDPDFVVYTPTAESGLDIQSRFDRGLLIATGVLSPINMLQMLGRCRQCHEWFVSAPRFTGTEAKPVPLDGKRATKWVAQLRATFEQFDIQTSVNTYAWSQWQETTRDIEKAFNSEYLYCLLEHFFESVETITLNSTRTAEWRELRDQVVRDGIVFTLSANLENGQEMRSQKRHPSRDSEVWDLELAEHYSRFPKVVKDLVERYQKVKDMPQLQAILQDWDSVDDLGHSISGLVGQLAELEEPLQQLREAVDVQSRILAEDPTDAEVAAKLTELRGQMAEAEEQYRSLEISCQSQSSVYQSYRAESDTIDRIVDVAKVFFSRRVERLKNWRMALRPRITDDLLAEVRSRFTTASSGHWKQFIYTRLFQALDLAQVAVARCDKLEAHKTGFNRNSPIVEDLWQRFNSLATVKELFPAVETKDHFWGLIRKVMAFMGFQLVSQQIRVATEEQHPNGRDRHGRQRYSRSQSQRFTGWLLMELSGNQVFQEIFEMVVAEIDNLVDRELRDKQNYLERRTRKRQEAEWEAAA